MIFLAAAQLEQIQKVQQKRKKPSVSPSEM